jgi:hypothetical protein
MTHWVLYCLLPLELEQSYKLCGGGGNLDWDTAVPNKFITLWKVWLEELFELPKFIKIPRHLGFGINAEIQLHVFVDASTKVFAATVYAQILEM